MKEDAPNEEPPATPATSPTTELLFCGSTKWDLLGRKTIPKAVAARGGSDAGDELLSPFRLRFLGLPDKKFVSLFSGCAAAHLILVDDAGVAYGLGRNDAGQLTRPDLRVRRHPVKFGLPGLKDGERVVHAACGRQHTLLVTSEGRVFSAGGNANGQLGNGTKTELKKPDVAEWQTVQLPPGEKATCVGAGAEFSAFACESGAVYAAGSGQYGQLGNGRTGECIESRNRIGFDTVTKPVRVIGFGAGEGEVKVKQIACGTNHTLALDENGKVWSWGFGGYGRLGHKKPEDVLRPKRIETFESPAYCLDIVACGQSSSFAVQKNRKSCYMWGMTKRTGESTMYPKPLFDLQGWQIRSISSGATSTVVSAERSVISWGCSPTFGELGYGEGKPKSSTKPKIMESVEGLVAMQVTEGMAFSAMLVSVDSDEDKKIFDALPMYEIENEEPEDESGDTGAKRKLDNAKGQSKSKSKSRKKRR